MLDKMLIFLGEVLNKRSVAAKYSSFIPEIINVDIICQNQVEIVTRHARAVLSFEIMYCEDNE